MNRSYLYFGVVLVTPLMMASAPSFAQGRPAQVSEARGDSEIIVTARRRAEDIQKVPASITAFGATQLAERGIRSEEDLQMATPGLVLRQTQGQNQLNPS